MASPACWGCAPALLLREVIPSQAGQILLEPPSILLWLAFLELDWLVGGERKESRDGMLMGQWLMKGLSISERFDVPGVHGGSGLQTTKSGGGFVFFSNLWKASGRKFLSMPCSCLWDMWIQVALPGGSVCPQPGLGHKRSTAGDAPRGFGGLDCARLCQGSPISALS